MTIATPFCTMFSGYLIYSPTTISSLCIHLVLLLNDISRASVAAFATGMYIVGYIILSRTQVYINNYLLSLLIYKKTSSKANSFKKFTTVTV